ncbi:MAG TPA: signal recognition particle-docking protein FtsY [Methanocellales archaeon]|nr:signal recognition particle-docking protein FtsY [Methanocellales archaeon]
MFDGVKKRIHAFQKEATTFLKGELDEKTLDKMLLDFELSLIESDVALPVAEAIIQSVKANLFDTKRKQADDVLEGAIRDTLKKVLYSSDFDFDEYIKNAAKPVKILFVGINGVGKTTTLAKIAQRLQKNGHSVVIAAGDTHRVGASEQISIHANRLGVKLIEHQIGADPTAVIYDGVQYAAARHKDVLLADTAGRLHTKVGLMDQLKKICRVISPDLVIFVDEAIAGNDAVVRAQMFKETVDIDGSILTKADVDVKGGAAISIAYATGSPILFLGTGQEYEDLVKFQPEWLFDRLFEE